MGAIQIEANLNHNMSKIQRYAAWPSQPLTVKNFKQQNLLAAML